MTFGDRGNIGLTAGDADTDDESGQEQDSHMVAGDPHRRGEGDESECDKKRALKSDFHGQTVGGDREHSKTEYR